jgi:hypothetical protein
MREVDVCTEYEHTKSGDGCGAMTGLGRGADLVGLSGM